MSSSSDSTQPGLALRPFEAKILGALLRSFEPDILVNYDTLQAQLGYKTKRSAQSGWSHLKRKIMDAAVASGLPDQNKAKKTKTNNATDADTGTDDAHEHNGGEYQQMVNDNEQVADNHEHMAENIASMNISNGHLTPAQIILSKAGFEVSASPGPRYDGPGNLWRESVELATPSTATSSPMTGSQQKHQ